MSRAKISVYSRRAFDRMPGEAPQGISKVTEFETEAVVPNVAVITEGPAESHFVTLGEGTDAKEYQMMIDATTIQGIIEQAGKYENGVKVKANHRSGVQDVIGRLTDFAMVDTTDGKKKATATLHLFKTSPLFEHLLNLVKTIPDAIGLSAFFDGPMQKIGEAVFMRCSELFSVDLVSDPSANPSGVFEMKVDTQQKDQGAESTMTPDDIKNACEAAIKPHIDGIHSRLASLEASHKTLEASHQKMAKHVKMPADGAGDTSVPAGNPGAVEEEAMYSRLLARVIADPKIGEKITAELQNTAKTITALGLVPGTGPQSSVGRDMGDPARQGNQDPEKMEFMQIVELEFNKPENAHKPDFQIVREVTMKYPAKHRAALEKRDPVTLKFTGLDRLPTRRVPYKPAA